VQLKPTTSGMKVSSKEDEKDEHWSGSENCRLKINDQARKIWVNCAEIDKIQTRWGTLPLKE